MYKTHHLSCLPFRSISMHPAADTEKFISSRVGIENLMRETWAGDVYKRQVLDRTLIERYLF